MRARLGFISSSSTHDSAHERDEVRLQLLLRLLSPPSLTVLFGYAFGSDISCGLL